VIGGCRVCKVPRAYFAAVGGDCNGLGERQCLCGGDVCICHNHGAVPCPGCPECDPTTVLVDDGWPRVFDAEPIAEAAAPKIATGRARSSRHARGR
jgi:hypothetical protein